MHCSDITIIFSLDFFVKEQCIVRVSDLDSGRFVVLCGPNLRKGSSFLVDGRQKGVRNKDDVRDLRFLHYPVKKSGSIAISSTSWN
jgi:hypothetical protein